MRKKITDFKFSLYCASEKHDGKSAIRLYKKLKDRFDDLKISFDHVEGNIVTNIHIKRRMDTTRAYKEEDEAVVLVNN